MAARKKSAKKKLTRKQRATAVHKLMSREDKERSVGFDGRTTVGGVERVARRAGTFQTGPGKTINRMSLHNSGEMMGGPREERRAVKAAAESMGLKQRSPSSSHFDKPKRKKKAKKK